MSDDETETAAAFATLYADRPDVLAKLFIQMRETAFAEHQVSRQSLEALKLAAERIAQLTAIIEAAGLEVPA